MRRGRDQFIASVSTEKAQKDYADELLKGWQPTDKRVTLENIGVGLSDVGGLRVLRMETRVAIGSPYRLGAWMIAVHRGRLM